jgi:hypothetical protein
MLTDGNTVCAGTENKLGCRSRQGFHCILHKNPAECP